MTEHVQAEPMPAKGEQSVTRAVMADLAERERQGVAKYGTTLQTFNGRRALVDAYQEAIDLTQYIKQELLERERLQAERDRYRAALARIAAGEHDQRWHAIGLLCHVDAARQALAEDDDE